MSISGPARRPSRALAPRPMGGPGDGGNRRTRGLSDVTRLFQPLRHANAARPRKAPSRRLEPGPRVGGLPTSLEAQGSLEPDPESPMGPGEETSVSRRKYLGSGPGPTDRQPQAQPTPGSSTPYSNNPVPTPTLSPNDPASTYGRRPDSPGRSGEPAMTPTRDGLHPLPLPTPRCGWSVGKSLPLVRVMKIKILSVLDLLH